MVVVVGFDYRNSCVGMLAGIAIQIRPKWLPQAAATFARQRLDIIIHQSFQFEQLVINSSSPSFDFIYPN
jgi:hypothetical protein